MQWKIPTKTLGIQASRILTLLYLPGRTITEISDILGGWNVLDVRRLNEITRLYIKLNMPNETTSIKIPDGNDGSSIGFHAFLDCTGLKEVIIHEGGVIHYRAFEGCTGLRQLVIPKDAVIGAEAFWGCIGLKEVVIHERAHICWDAFRGSTSLTKVDIHAGAFIDREAFLDCTGLTEVIIDEGADVMINAFYGCNSLILIVVPDDFPRDNLPVGATIVTHTKHKEMNDFYSKYGFQDLELKDKIKIYKLCHSSDEVSHENFEQLSHLSVVTMLNFIQAYSEIPSNIVRGKKPLEWTMGKGFVDAHPDKDVSGMISIARDEGPNSQLQEYMSVKDWRNTYSVSKVSLLTSIGKKARSEEKSEDGLEPKSTSKPSG